MVAFGERLCKEGHFEAGNIKERVMGLQSRHVLILKTIYKITLVSLCDGEIWVCQYGMLFDHLVDVRRSRKWARRGDTNWKTVASTWPFFRMCLKYASNPKH